MDRNHLLIILFIVFASNLFSQNTPEEFEKMYQERIHLERINDVYIPKNVEDAMLELDRLTDSNVAAGLIQISEDSLASKLHFSLGRWMQINWGLEEGSRLSFYLKSKGLSFPDDMEDLLIRCWYRHLSNKDLEQEKLIENYIAKRKADYAKKISKFKVDTLYKGNIKN